MPTTERLKVTSGQYTALLDHVVLPTPVELFEFQVSVLQEIGLDLRDTDVRHLRDLIPQESQLFLLVPRKPDIIDLKRLMKLINLHGKTGENYLGVTDLSDLTNDPTGAHVLLDVEDGRARLNTKPSLSMERIKAEKRIAYTTWYGLIHGIVFPCVLDHHNLDLVGSRSCSSFVPNLCRASDGIPKFNDGRWIGKADPRWGAPSAGSQIGT